MLMITQRVPARINSREMPAMAGPRAHQSTLDFLAGDWVEVRSAQEILASLDQRGCLDALPFMPEMLQFCGRRFRVFKRADKTCDTISSSGGRRMHDTVHLEGTRCDGQAHGGCQALCLTFWKEAWLKPVRASEPADCRPSRTDGATQLPAPISDPERLSETTWYRAESNHDEVRYRCQATELLRASTPLPWWDVRQYVRDVRSGNVRVTQVVGAVAFRMFLVLLRLRGYRLWMWCYNRLQSWRGGTPFPLLAGTLDKTPHATLGLKPGELVEVKSYQEILETVNKGNRNRGLSFDREMVRSCGRVHRVRSRVERLIDERTGKLINLSSDCLILEGAYCRAEYSENRLFCPRSLYSYWREIWLKRVEVGDGDAPIHEKDPTSGAPSESPVKDRP
jgi:hypothetical protein